jgi:hypothetical protein
MASSHLKDDKAVLPEHVSGPARDSHDIVSVQGGDLLDLESVDPVLNAKMKLVNDTIDEIGFTKYQAKLFVLNGFGYVTHLYVWKAAKQRYNLVAGRRCHVLSISDLRFPIPMSSRSRVGRNAVLKHIAPGSFRQQTNDFTATPSTL